jgi:mRNA-degrading endonuclease RelE of RelBE toxin-antitoxin system
MLDIEYSPRFISIAHKIKNEAEKERIHKHIRKIIENPEIGKPMQYARKGTRETYLGSFRLSYAYLRDEKRLIFLDIYHKDEQ